MNEGYSGQIKHLPSVPIDGPVENTSNSRLLPIPKNRTWFPLVNASFPITERGFTFSLSGLTLLAIVQTRGSTAPLLGYNRDVKVNNYNTRRH